MHTSPKRVHLMKIYAAKLSFLYVFNCTTLKHTRNAEGILIRKRRQRHCTPWSIVILNSSQELLPQLRSMFTHPGGHSMSFLVLSFSKCFSESSSFLDWRNVNFQPCHFLILLHAYKRLERVGFFFFQFELFLPPLKSKLEEKNRRRKKWASHIF